MLLCLGLRVGVPDLSWKRALFFWPSVTRAPPLRSHCISACGLGCFHLQRGSKRTTPGKLHPMGGRGRRHRAALQAPSPTPTRRPSTNGLRTISVGRGRRVMHCPRAREANDLHQCLRRSGLLGSSRARVYEAACAVPPIIPPNHILFPSAGQLTCSGASSFNCRNGFCG